MIGKVRARNWIIPSLEDLHPDGLSLLWPSITLLPAELIDLSRSKSQLLTRAKTVLQKMDRANKAMETFRHLMDGAQWKHEIFVRLVARICQPFQTP